MLYALAALVASFALFLAALALLVWVAFRYYTLAVTYDRAILQHLTTSHLGVPSGTAPTSESLLGSQLKEFIASRMKPTEGDFITNTDDELYVQEEISKLRQQGMGGISEEELKAFVSQAVSDQV